MGTFATVINTISPFRYSYEAEVVNELSRYPTIWNTASLYNKLGFHPRDRDGDVTALIVYFVLANVMAYVWAETVYSNPRILKNIKEQLDLLYERAAKAIKTYLDAPADARKNEVPAGAAKTDAPVPPQEKKFAPAPRGLNPTKGVKIHTPDAAGVAAPDEHSFGAATRNPLSPSRLTEEGLELFPHA
jgi:hypothetical protein